MAQTVVESLAASLTRYNMLSPGDSLGVAVSGGADSVVLLHLLHRLAGTQITVLHVNHGLRGDESEADETFVRNLSHSLGLPIRVQRASVETGNSGTGNLEQLARDARRAFFAETRLALKLRYVALGHNKTDQAETVLYRFLRGSGLAGLAGMSPVTSDGYIRPLLDVTRQEIRDWAAGQGIEWRDDSTNQSSEFVRNRLRLEFVNPQIERVLSATATVARDEEDWWSSRIGPLFESTAQSIALGLQFPVAKLALLHIAEQRRLIRHAIRKIKGDLRSIDVSHIEAVLKLIETNVGHDRILVPGVDALRSFDVLLLTHPGKLGAEPRHYRMVAKFDQEMALPHSSGRLYVSRVKQEHSFCANFGVDACSDLEVFQLDGDVLERAGPLDSLHVRNWEPGDGYRRAGHKKPEKIKSWFQEFRILLWERRRWPVLEIEDQIVWSRRFGAAAEFQATDESRNIVRIAYIACNGSTPAWIDCA